MSKQLDTIRRFLDERQVDYEVMRHREAYTAQEIADAQSVPGRILVKSVIVKEGSTYMMCVLPAIHLVDFERLEEVTGRRNLELASESEMSQLFPNMEVGAEPPFGNWEDLNLPVYVDSILEEDKEIVFNGGTHTETIKMNYTDWKRLAKPILVDFGIHV